jgi:hypothetical protein
MTDSRGCQMPLLIAEAVELRTELHAMLEYAALPRTVAKLFTCSDDIADAVGTRNEPEATLMQHELLGGPYG